MWNVIRMDKTRVAKKISESKPEGTMKMGRPRLRCLEDAENDVTELKMENIGAEGNQERRMGICYKGG